MAWLHFIKNFDFSPAARKGHVTIAYRAGSKLNVTRECAAAAKAAGAVIIEHPARKETPDGEETGRG